MEEKKAKVFFQQQWLKKFPQKRKRRKQEEIYAEYYWGGHLVYRILKQKIEKHKETDEKKQLLNRATDSLSKPPSPFQKELRKLRTKHLPPI